MRFAAATALLVLAAVAGCGASHPSPESVVRAWSHALNTGDNEGAADLFAENARVIQSGRDFRLRTRMDAVAFNESLPCSGKIVAISTDDDTTTATFLLGDRTTSACDGPGHEVQAQFRIHKGKIVLWKQLPTQAAPPAQPV